MRRMITLEKYLVLFLLGALSYYNIELMWRGFSHVSMAVCGGLSLVLIGGLNQWDKKLSVPGQIVLGSVIITILEFVIGMVVNRWMGLKVWDYSDRPFNFYGQICPQYTIYWLLLSNICIIVDDWIRVRVFGEEVPKNGIWYMKMKKIPED